MGQRFASPDVYEVTSSSLAAYASEFDPQPIHLDPEAAAQGMFGGIVASGWHSLSATMRLMVASRLFSGGPIVGVGIDRLRFLQAVRAGDELTAEAEVLAVRPSGSRRDRGQLVLRVVTRRRSDDEAVLTQDWSLLVPTREASTPGDR